MCKIFLFCLWHIIQFRYVTCIHTYICIFDNMAVCIDIVDVGWASQLHNGAVCVQFDDGNQLTVYSHKSEVTFVYRNGIISRYVYILYTTHHV